MLRLGSFHMLLSAATVLLASSAQAQNCPPLAGYALSLDGNSQYVHVPDAPDVGLSKQATLECWFYPSSHNLASRLINKGDGLDCYSDRSFDFGYVGDDYCCSNPRVLYASFFLSGTATGCGWAFLTLGNVEPDRWHHAATTIDTGAGGVMRLFLDGVLVSETTRDVNDNPLAGTSVRVSTLPLEIGATTPFQDTFFIGSIDEVRIWNIARTPSEIAAAYRTTVDPSAPGLVAYYRFDEGGGTTASDVTGHGHDGTIINGGAWQTTIPCCPADFNGDNFADSQDFFDFLAAFFASVPAADFNHDTFINSQDLFDFLAAFFAGCP